MSMAISRIFKAATVFAGLVSGNPSSAMALSQPKRGTGEVELFSQGGSLPANEPSVSMPLFSTSHAVTPNYKLYEHPAWVFDGKTPLVNEEFIRNYVFIDDAALRQKTIEHILEARNSCPEVAMYIDFVFIHLPGFHIVLHLTDSEKKSNDSLAFFDNQTHAITIEKITSCKSPALWLEVIRHEFRHAFFYTLSLFNKDQDFKFSAVHEISNLAADYLKKDEATAHIFTDDLSQFKKIVTYMSLTKKQTSKYKEERRIINKYQKIKTQLSSDLLSHYKIIYRIPHPDMSSVKTNDTFNFLLYNSDVEVKIKIIELIPQEKEVICALEENEIIAISDEATAIKKTKNYALFEQMAEADAHLIGKFHPEIYKLFFPKFYGAVQSYINIAMDNPNRAPQPYNPLFGQYFFPGNASKSRADYTYDILYKKLNRFDSQNYYDATVVFFQAKNFQKAKTLAKEIISKSSSKEKKRQMYIILCDAASAEGDIVQFIKNLNIANKICEFTSREVTIFYKNMVHIKNNRLIPVNLQNKFSDLFNHFDKLQKKQA